MGEAAQSAQRKLKADKLAEETIEEIETVAMGLEHIATDWSGVSMTTRRHLNGYSSRLKKLVEGLSR